MEQKQLQEKIMNEIAERGLTSKPRWHFLFKDSVVKAAAAFLALLGGFAVATINFILTDHDWDIFLYLDRSLLEHILRSLPYLWIILYILFFIATYYIFRQTRRGYRYSTVKIFAATFMGSIMFGILLSGLGYDHYIHNRLLEQLPLYKRLVYTKNDIWIFPEQGLLSGSIESIQDEERFSLRDADGHLWNIQLADDTTVESGAVLASGTRVKLIGESFGESVFQAEVIRPWGR